MTTTDPIAPRTLDLDLDRTVDDWTTVCALDRLTPDRGMAALVGAVAVAVFRLGTGELYAIGNLDPFSGASVLSRGLVGDAGGAPTVASPLYKQRFDLRTGVCIDDPEFSVPVFPVEVVDGVVRVCRAAPS
jgi:nitrite reductase (NADH) small subunit